ncbi:MAG: helix-turn-helix domain-containing protein [Kibdelosporangium sp.]
MSTEALVDPAPPEQRELLRMMLTRLPEFADRLAKLLSEQDELYQQIEQVAPDELRRVCRANLERALSAFADGRELPLDAAHKTGLAQARQGIPLPAVLRAFRIGGMFVYEALLGLAGPGFISSTQTVAMSSTVWRTIDLYSTALATAYDEVATQPPPERRHLLENLLQGRLSGHTELAEAAAEFGLPSSGMFVAVVTDAVEPGWHNTIEPLLRARRWWSLWRDSGEAGVVVIDRVEDVRRVRDVLASLPLAMGMSKPFNNLRDIPDALRRARVARLSLPAGRTGVTVFGDSPVTTLVAGAPTMTQEMVRATLAGVLALPPAERKVLLDTLAAWFAGHGSARESADQLFVHPNTVRYRLRRVQELTRRDLSDPTDVGELYVALASVRLEAG